MITIQSFSGLEEFGIIPLTMESCGLGYRMLCDLTKQGKAVIEKCLGVQITSDNWNNGAEDNPHIASIMLSRDMLIPLAIFSLLENGYVRACIMRDTNKDSVHEFVVAFDADDLAITEGKGNSYDWYMSFTGDRFELMNVLEYRGTAGSRNTHEMSGRVY